MVRNAFIAGSLALVISAASSQPSDARDGKKAAVIAGAILGAIALSASSKEHRHERHRNYYHHRGYQGRREFASMFSPHAGVICYYNTRTCYHDGRFSPRWTRRSFAY